MRHVTAIFDLPGSIHLPPRSPVSGIQALEKLSLPSDIRKKSMKGLYKMCAHHMLFPASLKVELPYNPTEVVLHHGGFGDVSKHDYQGQAVAVKTLRIYPKDTPRETIHVGF